MPAQKRLAQEGSDSGGIAAIRPASSATSCEADNLLDEMSTARVMNPAYIAWAHRRDGTYIARILSGVSRAK